MSKSKGVESNQDLSMKEEEVGDEKEVQCPECGSKTIIQDYERAELICSACGLVIMESIIDNSRGDRRAYTSEEKQAREHRGAPLSPMLSNYGLTTIIDIQSKQWNNKIKRIKQWNERLTWAQRNLLIATNEIRRLGALLGLPKQVEENAAILYRKVFKRQLLRGRSINSFVPACVYLSCRQNNLPRTLKEICKFSKSRAKTIRHSTHIIVRELNLKIMALKPSQLIAGIVNKLKLSNEVERRTLKILKVARDSNIILGKDPKGVAAAAIYIACMENGERRSQSDIATTAGITEVTLRNRYKELKTLL
ncbi:MAG: transcription initiation factor IIB [Candidatus Helarchaeota archaeon]|nr:transcription initiation factor IIB [Candidatus Helarchaeota archaeon]